MVKKNVYRAVPVNEIDVEKLGAIFAGKLCVCGVDVAKVDFFAALMDADRRVAVILKWKHPGQTPLFLALFEGLQAARVDVVLESSGTYGDPLRYLLDRKRVPVFRVNTKKSHDAAELFDGVPSWHDAKSAALLARLHLDGVSDPWPLPTERVRQLTAAGKRHERLVDALGRAVNQLESELARHWPELTAVLSLRSVAILHLLAQLSTPAAVAANSEKAREVLRRASRNAVTAAQLQAILAAAVETLGVPAVDAEAEGIRELASEALRLRQLIDASSKKLRAVCKEETAWRAMASVVGSATAARLLADTGDPRQYTSASAYEKSLGLNLKVRSSGKKKGKLTLTKRGSPLARKLLFLSAMRAVQHHPIIGAWHRSKVQRDGGVRLKSITAIARKLARAIWHVARYGENFDPAKLFDTRCLDLAA